MGDADPDHLSGVAKTQNDSNELPFLVTHYLRNYGTDAALQHQPDPEQEKQHQRIRKAAAELASAFSALGAFGTSSRPALSEPFPHQAASAQTTTYADLNRKWSGLKNDHLQSVVNASGAASRAVALSLQATAPVNYSKEAGPLLRGQKHSKSPSDGRQAQSAIEIDEAESSSSTHGGLLSEDGIVASCLQKPAHLQIRAQRADKVNVGGDLTKLARGDNSFAMESRHRVLLKKFSESMRNNLDQRQKVQTLEQTITSLQASIRKNEREMKSGPSLQNGGAQMKPASTILNNGVAQTFDRSIKSEENMHTRVHAQLCRKLEGLQTEYEQCKVELNKTEARAKIRDRECSLFARSFDDIVRIDQRSSPDDRLGFNFTFNKLLSRQRGINSHPARLSDGFRIHRDSTIRQIRKNMIQTRMSHAITINAHLTYPVYCLRFDRTGRYFVSAADDFLTKVFFIGPDKSRNATRAADGSRHLKCNLGANARGAVLVCSLRGHAGVINDIAVSLDNCFLATASVDGDCRVWGLRDGCPIAILRGHKGGANMVSWSTLTPHRLITSGADGFARMWGIREATLKRYGVIVGKRPEYNLWLAEPEQAAEDDEHNTSTTMQVSNEQTVDESTGVEALNMDASPPNALEGLVLQNDEPVQFSVPPLPASVPPLLLPLPLPAQVPLPVPQVPPVPIAVPMAPLPAGGGVAAAQNAQNNIQIGQFVQNDVLDEGVVLLAKYTHDDDADKPAHVFGTRSRKTTVNVICVSRHPSGGYFVTGSDDGICRVWKDNDDERVAIVDALAYKPARDMIGAPLNGGATPQHGVSGATIVESKPLLKLMGHSTAITDLSHSHAGDRILSASQKDGVVRIWFLAQKLVTLRQGTASTKPNDVPHIIINLIHPASCRDQPQTGRRKKRLATTGSKVSCDVAVWSSDDSKIFTSQCILLKQSGTEVQPGSQYIFLWDSTTGYCLLGIAGAHKMQCPVIIPCICDDSLFCSAGADGELKVWDCESGCCIFSYANKIEPNNSSSSNTTDRTVACGFLDGSFSPDGSHLVLTDEKGRLSIFDFAAANEISDDRNAPEWMKEQYFANDYYELQYDTNGYCVERGSEQPPHLAPRGVRATQSGSPMSAEINETYIRLRGPLPLSIVECQRLRAMARSERTRPKNFRLSSLPDPSPRIRRGLREYDPNSTILIDGESNKQIQIQEQQHQQQHQPPPIQPVQLVQPQSSVNRVQANSVTDEAAMRRELSSNYRWRDYDDLLREQGNDDDAGDSDDEEFDPAAANNGRTIAQHESDDSDEELRLDGDDDDDVAADNRNRTRRRGPGQPARRQIVQNERRERAQRRGRARTFHESDSDDEALTQYLSANLTPSGPYLRDFMQHLHFWRFQTGSSESLVRREWVSRRESDSSFRGRKIYCPQVGDSVVYIPRAHLEVINAFPMLRAPYAHWPAGTEWPVLRCSIRAIRYRFPFGDYYRASAASSRCVSIVAILTMEITGLPNVHAQREFPWPEPTFSEVPSRYLFEVAIFENTFSDFVLPCSLYISRVTALENAIRNNGGNGKDLIVQVYYGEELQEDEELVAYSATITHLIRDQDDEDIELDEVHLLRSGFETVHVLDKTQKSEAVVSPWEVDMTEDHVPPRTRLSDAEKNFIVDKLRKLEESEEVRNHLSHDVDIAQYPDYNDMIEVPMNLTRIKDRIRHDFYSSKYGPVADVQLIKDNCLKYNGGRDQLSRAAEKASEEFALAVLSDEERSNLVSESDFDAFLTANPVNRQSSWSQGANGAVTSVATGTQQRPSRSQPSPTNNRRTRIVINREAVTRSEEQNARQRSLRSSVDINAVQPIPGRATAEIYDDGNIGNNILVDNFAPTRQSATDFEDDNNNDDDGEEIMSEYNASVASSVEGNGGGRSSKRRRTATRRDSISDASDGQTNSRASITNRSTRTTRRNNSASGGVALPNQDTGRRTTRASQNTRSRGGGGGGDGGDYNSHSNSDDNDIASDDESGDASSYDEGARRSARSKSTKQAAKKSQAFDDDDDDDDGEYWDENQEVDSDDDIDSDDDNDTARKPTKRGRNTKSRAAAPRSNARQTANASDGQAVTTRTGRTHATSPSSSVQRRTTRNQQNLILAQECGRANPEEHDLSQPEHIRRSTRARVSPKVEQSDSQNNESETMADEKPRSTRSRRTGNGTGIGARQIYKEDGSDDDDFDDVDDDDTQSVEKTVASRKRTRGASQSKKGSKKQRNGSLALPQLEEWPTIPKKRISSVANNILDRIGNIDTSDTFAIPVIEAYPEMKGVYLSAIEEPMDLRTIREERLPTYTSIQELQRDLILVFLNCCTYNHGPSSEIFLHSVNIWSQLNDIFREICVQENVRLPKGWEG